MCMSMCVHVGVCMHVGVVWVWVSCLLVDVPACVGVRDGGRQETAGPLFLLSCWSK